MFRWDLLSAARWQLCRFDTIFGGLTFLIYFENVEYFEIKQWLYHANISTIIFTANILGQRWANIKSRFSIPCKGERIFPIPYKCERIFPIFSWKMQTYSSRRRRICWANRKWTTQRRTKIGMKRFVTIKRLFCCMTWQVKKAWRLFDKNGDGKISKQEFRWDNYLI